MANISLTLYRNGFIGSVLKSPIQMGSLRVNNSVTNISRLGTFKQRDINSYYMPLLYLEDCRSPKPSSYLHWQAHYLKRVTDSIRRLQYFHAKSANCMQRRSCIGTLLGEPRFIFMKLIIGVYTHQCLSNWEHLTIWLSSAVDGCKI
jgi:hypothetical protein